MTNLPLAHQALLRALTTELPAPVLDEQVPAQKGGVRVRLNEVDDRLRRNADVLGQVADFCRDFLGILGDGDEGQDVAPRVCEGDQDRVRTALRQMARDWSAAGADERDAAYRPLLEAVEARRTRPAHTLRVLVPGAGLGRLAFDFAMRGYCAQGNEFSYFMLIPAHFLLNNTESVGEHVIYPYVHSTSNWRTAHDLLEGVRIPDVLPSSLAPGSDFSMVAGEFVEVYAKPEERGRWDAVATCYFLDTAKNVLRYMEVINAVLPIDGLWVNLGPLLWHFEHDSAPSLELTLDEVTGLLPMMGFAIEEIRTLPAQAYTGNAQSMLAHQYRPVFWVCRKVRDHAMAPPV